MSDTIEKILFSHFYTGEPGDRDAIKAAAVALREMPNVAATPGSTDAVREALGREANGLACQLINAASRAGIDTYTATMLLHASSLIDRLAAAPQPREGDGK